MTPGFILLIILIVGAVLVSLAGFSLIKYLRTK